MSYLVAEGLTCGYGLAAVLTDFNLAVAQGEFLAVVGPNGSGKSTLLKALTRTLAPARGRVALGGREIWSMRSAAFARRVAVVAQEAPVDFEFTVAEVVLMGRLPYLRPFRGEGPADHAAVARALAATDTQYLAERLVTGLSGGERQRVMVARALAQEPELLVLDEPTSHLDIGHQVELLDLIRRLNREQGVTVVAVLHDLNLAAQYASRMVMIREGRLHAEGAPGAVVSEQNVRAVYGSRVRVMAHPEEGSPHVILLSGQR